MFFLHSKQKVMFTALGALLLLAIAGCDSAPAPAANPIVPPATTNAAQVATPQPAAPQPTKPPAGPVAVVNGQEVSAEVYQREVARRQAGLAQRGVNLNTPQGQAQLTQEKQMALDNMIDDMLIAQEAARQGVSVTDAEIEAAFQEIIKQVGSQQAFEQLLAQSGQTLDEARSIQRTQMLNNKMRDKVVAGIQTAEQVRARHILVDALATAQALLAQIQGGADFGTVAQQSSLDTTTKSSGGDLGWFPRGVLPSKELEDAAFSLQPGQLSNVVQSAFGYHLLQVLERDAARPLAGEQLVLVQQQAMENWLSGLRAQAQVQRAATP